MSQPTPNRKCLIIANPISGRGLGRRIAPQLQAALRNASLGTELLFTSAAGDARKIAADASPDDTAAIVSVGGDGTLAEIVNGVADKRIPIAVFPVGTGNVLAKEYRIPRRVDRVVQMILRRRTIDLDVGVINGSRRFLLFCGVGFDAAVAETLSLHRTGPIRMATYVIPTLRTLWQYPFPALTITVDGQPLGTAASLLVSNVRSYGGPFKFTPTADPADGAFDVCVIRGARRIDVVRYFIAGFLNRFAKLRDVTCLRGRTIELTADGQPPIQADGDFIGRGSLRIELLPARLPIIIP